MPSVGVRPAANDAATAGDHEAAAWSAHAKAVEEAVVAGARAAIDYLRDARRPSTGDWTVWPARRWDTYLAQETAARARPGGTARGHPL